MAARIRENILMVIEKIVLVGVILLALLFGSIVGFFVGAVVAGWLPMNYFGAWHTVTFSDADRDADIVHLPEGVDPSNFYLTASDNRLYVCYATICQLDERAADEYMATVNRITCPTFSWFKYAPSSGYPHRSAVTCGEAVAPYLETSTRYSFVIDSKGDLWVKSYFLSAFEWFGRVFSGGFIGASIAFLGGILAILLRRRSR